MRSSARDGPIMLEQQHSRVGVGGLDEPTDDHPLPATDLETESRS